MRRSAARIALPDFDAEELRKLIVALCARDGAKWLPKERKGGFLYAHLHFPLPISIKSDSKHCLLVA